MNILFLTQILPYPPNSGPKVKTWHVLRYLSQRGHKITLASFVRPEELPYIENVKQVCASVHTVPMRRSRISDIGYLLRSQVTGRPFLVERDDLLEMRSLVGRIVAEGDVDIIHADQLTMTQYALPFAKSPSSRPALVFDAHNAVWTITERMRQNSPLYMRLPLTLETKRIKQYEGWIVRDFDATLAVTELDRDALINAVSNNGLTAPKSIAVIPIAVDTNQIRPVARRTGSLNLLTMGTLYYPPNADGIRWFVGEVFPLIRSKITGATLTIIGKNPPKDFLKLAEDKSNGILVTGFVPELDPYFAESALAVIPVRAGGGMRVRILEAFARAIPVVTTTVGLEGIDAQPETDVLVADSPGDFAEAVIRLFSDETLQAQLSTNGRRLVETKYDWQVTLKDMDEVYQQFG
jgi:glycosyltransferase involved in cell wall biosynthesis